MRTVSFTIGAASPVAFGAVAERGFLVMGGLAVATILLVQRL